MSGEEPELEWEDPPPQEAWTHDKQAKIVAALRRNRGKWALVHRAPNTSAAASWIDYRIKGRAASWQPIEDFEMTRRKKDVYARYVGPPINQPKGSK